jgi:hypothetical protein
VPDRGDGVLLFGRRRDPHVAAVAAELSRRCRPVLHLDPADYPRRSRLTFTIGPKAEPRHVASGLDLGSVGVGWIGGHRDVRLSGAMAGPGRRFARAAALQGLDSFLRGCPFPWVNDPDAAAVADDKVHQLEAAQRLGLEVPPTLVTNDPDEFRRFRREHGRVVAKAVAGAAGLPASKRVLTTVLGRRDAAHAEEVALAPVCFQAYVPKRSEVRATVVGGRVHAVRIHSQEQARTRHDWRRYGPGLRLTKATLPRPLSQRLVALARELGLGYGGVDLVQRPDGRYVFLEINTLPAWLWLEDATGEPLTASLADHLESCIGRGTARPPQKRKGKGEKGANPFRREAPGGRPR